MRQELIVLAFAVAQATGAPATTDFDALVTRVANAEKEYEKVFRNLVAEETKDEQLFDPSGAVKKQRKIVSDLLVYQSSHDVTERTEYLDVREVDGKAVGKRSKRVLELLSKASKASSMQSELQTIGRESSRYDLAYTLRGLTISQPGMWFEKPGDFHVEWAGREQIDGHDVVVIDYRDNMPNRGDFSRGWLLSNGVTSSVMRGRMWVDAATGQLRRDRWELTGIHPALQEPVTLVRRESVYAESRFGILVPQRVVIEFFEHAKAAKNERPSFFRVNRTTCTYGEFRRFDVATEETIGTPASKAR
jgi:hypothetical protein